jgi:DNA-binding Xre family transcriptional regulator
MLSFNVTPIFKARNIDRPYTYLVKAGFSSQMAHSIVNNQVKTLNLKQVELLCRILVCEPNDLLAFSPDKDQLYPADHPLLKLQVTDTNEDLSETLAAMPYKQLKALSQQITSKV